jgi:dienelactone hydrolase
MVENTVENPRQNVTFPSNGDTAHGYLALPPSGSGPGVIVIQEWWGLTDHIADITDGFYPVDQARAQEEKIRSESGADVEFHYYDAGHAFHNDQNPLGTYSEKDAKSAWKRTVDFLKAKLT